jgi:hypothetical protein
MKNLIRKILKEETEVYHIFEDSDFDPFGHITEIVTSIRLGI